MPLFHARVFVFALICIDNAKASGNTQMYRSEARKHVAVVREQWVVEKQAFNVVHKLMIFNAEIMTLKTKKSNEKGDTQLIIHAFDKAIVAVTKACFLWMPPAHLASRVIAERETSSRSTFVDLANSINTWAR